MCLVGQFGYEILVTIERLGENSVELRLSASEAPKDFDLVINLKIQRAADRSYDSVHGAGRSRQSIR
jgi:hypothetical protein